MSNLNNLKSLLGGKPLILRGEAKAGSDIPYSDQEKNLCTEIVSALMELSEVTMKSPVKVSAEVNAILMEVHEEEQDLAHWARAAYRGRVRAILAHNESNPDDIIEGFVKVRDAVSILAFFRGACDKVGVAVSVKDTVFKKYGSDTVVKKA